MTRTRVPPAEIKANFPVFLRFLMVGGFATALQYVLFITAMHSGMGPTVVVSGAAFVISAVVNFFLTRKFTFRSQAGIARSGLRYAIVIGCGLFLNTVIMSILLAFGWRYIVCQLIATAGVLLWNFGAANRWVFRLASDASDLTGPNEAGFDLAPNESPGGRDKRNWPPVA